MSESPYAMPVEELVASAQVAAVDQVEEQAEPRVVPDWSSGVIPYADDMSGDADGD